MNTIPNKGEVAIRIQVLVKSLSLLRANCCLRDIKLRGGFSLAHCRVREEVERSNRLVLQS
jgi:hypothetical protein